MRKERFFDTGAELSDFTSTILVHCPACGRCARKVRLPESDGLPRVAISCGHCGFNARKPEHELPVRPWLQVPCCGEVLCAFNREHLDFLECFVGARLRQSRPGEGGWHNRSLVSRLPAWIKSARNRDEILKCIAKLRGMIED